MKVSVIISTRNRVELLTERALPSVLRQSLRDYEIIVIDDDSDDDVFGFSLPEGVRYYRNKKRMGLAYNRNLGVRKARGDYVVSLDDDNEFHPEFLKKTVEYLDSNPGVHAVGVGKTIVYPEGRSYHLPKLPCSINDGFLIRKSVFRKIRFDPELHANDDADFGIEFFKHFKLDIIDEPLMTVYASPVINTTSYSDYSDYHLDGLAKFWLKHHKGAQYIGRMFLLAAKRPVWFKPLYWLEEKLRRYKSILSPPLPKNQVK